MNENKYNYIEETFAGIKRDLETLSKDSNFSNVVIKNYFVPTFYNPDISFTKQCISVLSMLEEYVVNWCENTNRNIETTAAFNCKFLGETFPVKFISRLEEVKIFSKDLKISKWAQINILDSISLSIHEDDTILVFSFEPELLSTNKMTIEINGNVEEYYSPRLFLFRAIEEIKKL